MRALRLVAVVVIVTSGLTLVPSERAPVATAAECAASIGPGIPPPASVPSGIPGFHAAWYGQSGYPTLCPGQPAKAVVAFYNSGSLGWLKGPGQFAALGTWGPSPGQDQPSILGGDGTHGTPNTRFETHNRPDAMPAFYIGPGQVGWFEFTVKAPRTPGTYRFYLRPLIESVQWMEDYGVFWQVTVVPGDPPQRVTVSAVDKSSDSFMAGGTTYRYDRSDTFEIYDATITYEDFRLLLSAGDVIDIRYQSTAAGMSSFNVAADIGGIAPPTVKAEAGNFDGGPTKNDVSVAVTPPASNPALEYPSQRALVPSGTAMCEATSGQYEPPYAGVHPEGSYVDLNLPSGTYCYRSGPQGAPWFAYSAPVTVPAP
jgi:hypothetical protein